MVSEERKAYNRQYYIDNRDRILQRIKEYYVENKDEIITQHSEYQKNNPEVVRRASKKYYEKNSDKIIEKINERNSLKAAEEMMAAPAVNVLVTPPAPKTIKIFRKKIPVPPPPPPPEPEPALEPPKGHSAELLVYAF